MDFGNNLRRRKNEISAFSWYGGKTCHLDWLLPIINNVKHKVYVESFAGSAAILLNKIPSEVEVYNDIHSEVVNFFKILRTRSEELIPLLEFTPYAREEFSISCTEQIDDPLEKARRFFVRARQVRSGLATKATPGRWSYTKKDSRQKRALPVNQWFVAIEGLEKVCDRLKNIQIEHIDALDAIQRYDTPDTLHYVDPPYVMSSRTGGENYYHEFSDEQHFNLLNLLLSVQGKVVISGYINELYSKTLIGWKESRRTSCYANTTLQNGKKSYRQEVIWTNFDFELENKGWDNL
jgi:DNA adenine methylase